MSQLGDQIVDKSGKSLYFSDRYNAYVTSWQFCSEHFYCERCLTEHNEIVKGTHRYDSLVLCDVHNERFKPIMSKLRSVLENNPNVLIINDLGL